MTEWEYQLETYKVTMHFNEILIQSLIWPIIGILVIFGIKWLLGKHIGTLIDKIKDAKNIDIKDIKLTWGEDHQFDQLPKKPGEIYTLHDLIIAICDNAIGMVNNFKTFIAAQIATGTFLEDKVVDFSNDKVFVKTFFNNDTKADEDIQFMYDKILELYKMAKETPDKIDLEKFIKGSFFINLFIVNFAAREQAILQYLLSEARKKQE